MELSLLWLTPSKHWSLTLLIAVGLVYPPHCQAQIISTVAGKSPGGFYSGDGGLATNAILNLPNRSVVDRSGSLYIADMYNHRIRRVSSTGIITTVAGGGQILGDGGVATAATLNFPTGLAVDGSGNLYIADTKNNRIRKVSANGLITTVAGTGGQGFSGDGGLATMAQLNTPHGVTIDRVGNLYIADMYNNRIRKVDPAGIITTVAGGSQPLGDGGVATAANLNLPIEVVVDGSGNLYIADMSHHRIRKVNTAGVITTVAGTGNEGYSGDGGAATSAKLNFPNGLTIDGSGNLYIADRDNHRIRKVNTNGIITTVAGTGTQYYSGDGGNAIAAHLNTPSGVTIDEAGNLYITDSFNHRVRRVTPPPTTTPPVATTNTNQTAMVGTPFSYTVNAFTDAETPNNLSYSIRIDPANGFSFNPATRVISGTPTTSGVSSITITATDPDILSASTTFTITSTTACIGTPSPDYAALVDFYNATGGPNWTRNTNWGNGCSPCGWYGITCNSSGRVTDISLYNNHLSGPIPASLSALTDLQKLYLYDNQLNGSLPSSLGALTNLQSLYLSSNQLSGTIPASFSTLTKLTGLDLSKNQLSGSIPDGLGSLTNLQFLLLNNNQLSGCFPARLSALCGSDRVIDFSTNSGLPGGGDFYSFCDDGTGSCLPPSATNDCLGCLPFLIRRVH